MTSWCRLRRILSGKAIPLVSRVFLLALLAVSVPVDVGGQLPLYTRLGTVQNPGGISWWRISTEHYDIIYPDSLATEARRVALLAERYYDPLSRSLRAKPERLPIVLNNQSMSTNGYVALAPRRSQWYATPPATTEGFGPVDWYTLLAVHEGRHVVQEKAMRSGLIGFMSKLFGENTTSLLSGVLYFPAWLWEGDAVGTETALSEVGRGRQPAFTARMRALAADSQRYSYYAAWQGSQRTQYPDWYEHGYILSTYVRRHHGDSAWARVIRTASRNPLVPFALSMSLKHHTGRSLTATHKAAIAEADSLWRQQRDGLRTTPVRQLSPASSQFHNWALPQYAADGSVIAVYSDIDHVPQLVRLHDGQRETLVDYVGLYGDIQFHVAGDKIVWSEYQADPRYGERSSLVIKLYDLSSGALTRVAERTRWLNPVLSPDGQTIAARHTSLSRESSIVLLDVTTGVERSRIAVSPGGARSWMALTWSPDGSSLYGVGVDSTAGNALYRIDPRDGSTRTVIASTFDAISRPVARGSKVFYGTTSSGLDNIWVVDTVTLERAMVTSRPFGAYHASIAPSGDRMLYSDYSASGLDVVEAPLDSTTWVPERSIDARPVNFAQPLVAQEASLANAAADSMRSENAAATSPAITSPVAYRGYERLFDFHSLSLAPSSDDVNIGLALESRNLLNTLALSVGGVFNSNEQTGAFETSASYAGLPTIIDLSARIGSRASSYVDSSGTNDFSWGERSLSLGVRQPWTRLNGLTRTSVTAFAGVGITKIVDQPVAFRFENNNGTFVPANYGVVASYTRAAALRNLFNTGASGTVIYRHTPVGDYSSQLLAMRGVAVTRGLHVNHNVIVDAAHEEQRADNYRFSSQVPFPRGFGRRYHDRLSRVGVSYHAPLFYPDFAVGPIVYARRVQGAVFADWGEGSTRTGDFQRSYRSTGIELTADLALLGTRTTTRLGVRWTKRLSGDKATRNEFIISLPL